MKSGDIMKVSNIVFLWDSKCKKWLIPYPDMPTARRSSSSICHRSSVIVAGGITDWDSVTLTRSVEILHITDTNSYTGV